MTGPKYPPIQRSVEYVGASDEQVKWGSCADPRGILCEGQEYEIKDVDVHSYHTKLYLIGYPTLGFNSTCFKIKETGCWE